MNLKDFQSKVKKIKARVSMGGIPVCTVISDQFPTMDYGVLEIDVGYPVGHKTFSVKGSFALFFRPMTTWGSFLESVVDIGFGGYTNIWLGSLEEHESVERRVFWIEVWEQWMIVFGHYKKIKRMPEPYAA